MPISLAQGRRKNSTAGEKIFWPTLAMEASGTAFRRSQLSLVAGGPGAGKSAFVLYGLVKGLRGLATNRILYFSADTDAATVFIRVAAILTGWETSYIEGRLRADDTEEIEAIVANGASHIQMVFKSYPTPRDIDNQVDAYEEVWGVLPDVIVMDNLKNLDMGDEGGEEFSALEAACEELHELARETNAAVITLHHVEGKHEDGMSPIPLSGLRGKVSKTPEVVLTLHRDSQNLYVSPVKDRNGKADPSGKWFLTVSSDLSRMQYG